MFGKAVVLDIFMTSDRVSHKAWVSQLHLFGLNQTLVTWIDNFLTARFKVDRVFLNEFRFAAGVPHGSCISSSKLFGRCILKPDELPQ